MKDRILTIIMICADILLIAFCIFAFQIKAIKVFEGSIMFIVSILSLILVLKDVIKENKQKNNPIKSI